MSPASEHRPADPATGRSRERAAQAAPATDAAAALAPGSTRRLLLRSLLIQALWNPRDLQGSALAWALEEPVRPGHPPEPFNAHPYLAGVALGALTREAREARLPLEARLRFRAALRAPLGALGDSLVWAGWVPLLVLVAGGMLLVGAPPGVTVVTLLLAHNLLHLALRRWGIRLGLRHGVGVGSALASSPLRSFGDRARRGAVAGAGVVLGLVLMRGADALVPAVGAPTGPIAVLGGGLLVAALGLILAGRLPAVTPLRLLLLLAGAGWVAGFLLARGPS